MQAQTKQPDGLAKITSWIPPGAKASPLSDGPWGPTNPVADPVATLIVPGPDNSQIRLTVLTSRLIRVERASSANNNNADFENRKTVAVINRNLPVPSFQHDISYNNVLTVKTDCLTVTYSTGKTFSSSTFQVTGKMYCYYDSTKHSKEPSTTWSYHYGDQDPLNLLGTIRTLDVQNATTLNCTLMKSPASDHCEWGLISRSGYAIVNDTLNYVLSDDKDWWDGTNQDEEDFYVFGHGHDYSAALGDYRLIGGSIPLLPRYALGNWFSRWYDYTSSSAAEVVKRYEELSLPLDVFVLDMNWHTKNDWTGYSWDKRLWGGLKDALAYMKTRDLAVTMNLHDASGVNPWEDQYDSMCRQVGCKGGDPINFSIVNETIAYALEDVVLTPLEENGVDFWWIDWQQGEGGRGGAAGAKQNPTIWTAHIRSTNSNRRKTKRMEETSRSMVLARWGGLGAHRYPVHFSGDVDRLSWDNLAYQPYFSMTATNVGAIWSHDIEGPSQEPELYTRWLQWGVVSGISRAHDRGMSAGRCVFSNTCCVVEPWNVPPIYAQANFEALRLRGQLTPYLYTAAYHAHKKGRWFTTPMYYKWPELEGAYETAAPRPDQNLRYNVAYMLGDDLWVAPVVHPSNKTDGLARMTLWIPPGMWVGVPGGEVVSGSDEGTTGRERLADLSDIPMFARAGTIVPSIPVRPGGTIGLAMKPFDDLVWTIYLADGGPASGSGEVYEDDGLTTAYQTRDSFTITKATYNISSSFEGTNDEIVETIHRRATSMVAKKSDTLTFSVSTDGHCEKLPTTRATTLRIVNSLPPASVVVNGLSFPYARFGGKGSWSYESRDSAIVVETPYSQVAEGLEIVLKTVQSNDTSLSVDGTGFRLQRAVTAKAALDEIRRTPGSETGQDKQSGNLLFAASLGSSLESAAGLASPASFNTLLKSLPEYLVGAYHEIQQLQGYQQVSRASALLESVLPKNLN